MFCPRYTPPDKTNLHYIPPCAAELCEAFDELSALCQKAQGDFSVYCHTPGLVRICFFRKQKRRGCAGKPGRSLADGTEPDGGPLNTERMIV